MTTSTSPARRIAIATSHELAALHPDDLPLLGALRARGIEARACVWNDAAVDWCAFDAVLVRTIWDYFRKYDEYLAWLEQLAAQGVAAINPLPVLRWNADKRYLLELEQRGVAIVPTRIVRGAALRTALGSERGRELVVKPTVSGTAWQTVRGTAGTPDFETAVAALPDALDYLVQPYVPAIGREGEWSLLFFGGEFSHAVLKRARAGDYRVQSEFGGTAQLLVPPPQVMTAARATLAAVAQKFHAPLAYARVDGVIDDGRFLLMELELIEPHLFWDAVPGAVARLADVVAAQLQDPG